MRILPLGYKETLINGKPEPNGVAMFFELDVETLEQVAVDPQYIFDRELVARCFSQTGRNAHLYLLVNAGSPEEIIENFNFLLKEYDSVSWWTVEHRKFFIRRRNL
jgi:hypothetical protein